jgi:hypothetical protein
MSTMRESIFGKNLTLKTAQIIDLSCVKGEFQKVWSYKFVPSRPPFRGKYGAYECEETQSALPGFRNMYFYQLLHASKAHERPP